MKEYVLGTGAELDLVEIWEYIASDDIEAADRWIGKLFDGFDRIALNPESDTPGKTLPIAQSSSGRLAPT